MNDIASLTKPTPKPWILDIAAYVPGRSSNDSGGRVSKLSSNENPLGTSDQARAAFAAHSCDLQRYPDAGAAALRDAIAAHYGLDPARIIYGTGSDEILHLIAGTYAGHGDEVIQMRYGFAVYEIATKRVGATLITVDDSDYATDVDAVLSAITERTRIIFIANPNNPTGTFTPREDIARLASKVPPHVMIVIDQAYAEYLEAEEDDGGLDLARSQPNVLITRTFSKIYGLAAERIGWGYGSAEAVDAMHRIRAPFNITSAGQAAAIAAIADPDFVTHSRCHNAKWRSWFEGEIASLGNAGLRAVPSKANFLLVLFEGPVSAETSYKGLMARGYLTRWLPGQGLGHGLRITIGTEEEMLGLSKALREILGEGI
jgi:histidinol-phosphate aminotransferase